MAKGYQGPDRRTGNVDFAGRVRRRSSHLQVISLGALTKWPLWSLDIKNVCLQADGFDREVYLRAPGEWEPKDSRRVWKLRPPAYGLNGAPVAFHRPLCKFLANFAESLSRVGLLFEVSWFDPRMYFVYRGLGSAVGVLATHVDDILGCGETDIFGDEIWETVSPGGVARTRGHGTGPGEGFLCGVRPDGLYEEHGIIARAPLAMGRPTGTRVDELHQIAPVQVGGLCWVATAALPDICARPARIAPRINALRGSDVCRINELVRVAKEWRPATVLKYASSSHLWRALGWGDKVQGAR